MKKLRNIIIYGVIAVLIAAAFGGYFIQNHRHNSASQSVNADVKVKDGQILSTKDGDNIKNLSEIEKQNHIKKVMTKSTAAPDANPVVGIGRGSDFASVTSTAVKNAGGLSKIIKKGDVVAIKVNLCVQTENYGSPMTTDYRVTQEVINIARECGASKVIVVEGNFNSNAFLNTGTSIRHSKAQSFTISTIATPGTATSCSRQTALRARLFTYLSFIWTQML